MRKELFARDWDTKKHHKKCVSNKPKNGSYVMRWQCTLDTFAIDIVVDIVDIDVIVDILAIAYSIDVFAIVNIVGIVDIGVNIAVDIVDIV